MNRNKFISNTLWVVLSRWGQFLINAIIGIIVARHLGASLFGQLSILFAVVSILKVFALVGAELHLRRLFVEDGGSSGLWLPEALLARTAASIVLYIAAICSVSSWPGEEVEIALVAIAGLVLFSSVSDVLVCYYNSVHRAKIVGIAGLVGSLFGVSLRLAGVVFDLSLWIFVLAFTWEFVAAAILVLVVFLKEKPFEFTRAPSILGMWNLLRDSFPLYISTIAISIYLRVDQVMLGYFMGEQEAGIYAVAARFSDRLYTIPVALGMSMLPLIVNGKSQKDDVNFTSRMQRYFDFNILVSLLFIFGFVVGGKSLFSWLIGDEFDGAAEVLGLHLLGLPFMALGVSRGQYVVAERLYRFAMIGNVLGAMLNVGINLILIPLFGAIGAAVATLVSFALVHVGYSFTHPKSVGWGACQIKALLLPFRYQASIALCREVLDRVKKQFTSAP